MFFFRIRNNSTPVFHLSTKKDISEYIELFKIIEDIFFIFKGEKVPIRLSIYEEKKDLIILIINELGVQVEELSLFSNSADLSLFSFIIEKANNIKSLRFIAFDFYDDFIFNTLHQFECLENLFIYRSQGLSRLEVANLPKLKSFKLIQNNEIQGLYLQNLPSLKYLELNLFTELTNVQLNNVNNVNEYLVVNCPKLALDSQFKRNIKLIPKNNWFNFIELERNCKKTFNVDSFVYKAMVEIQNQPQLTISKIYEYDIKYVCGDIEIDDSNVIELLKYSLLCRNEVLFHDVINNIDSRFRYFVTTISDFSEIKLFLYNELLTYDFISSLIFINFIFDKYFGFLPSIELKLFDEDLDVQKEFIKLFSSQIENVDFWSAETIDNLLPLVSDKCNNVSKLNFTCSNSFQSQWISKISNFNNLEILNFKKISNFDNVNIKNLTQLKKINFVKCNELKNINLSNLNKLKEISIFKLSELETINFNKSNNIENILLRNCPELIYLQGLDSDSLESFRVMRCQKLYIPREFNNILIWPDRKIDQ